MTEGAAWERQKNFRFQREGSTLQESQAPQTLKEFEAIHEDYAFFERHSNETLTSISAWLPHLPRRAGPLAALDFGAGSGTFTKQFLETAAYPTEELSLTLVEPDLGFRTQAVQRLEPFSDHPIEAWPLLEGQVGPKFDLIFSHHVLYYVPNLGDTLKWLCAALKPGGRMLISQGGQDNGLNKIVFAAFEFLGERSPYHYSEQTFELLQQLEVTVTVENVCSHVKFPDSREGRQRILRFLLSEHLDRCPKNLDEEVFEPLSSDGMITIRNLDQLFIVEK